MRKYFNKLYLSIALVVLSLLTMVATTYAWVGLLTSSTFDEFIVKLQEHESENVSEYGIELSLDGVNFSEELNQTTLRRYLLKNYDSSVYSSYLDKNSNGSYKVSDNKVNDEFRRIKVDQCTTDREDLLGNQTTRLNRFTNMKGAITTKLLKFDLYISIFKIGDDGSSSDKKLDLYLRTDNLISSSTPENSSGLYSVNLFNKVTYPTAQGQYLGQPILGNPNVINSIPAGKSIDGNVKINIANSCRVAFEKFNVVDKGDIATPKTYDDELFIYQTGSVYPTYDSINDVYDFGGVLPNNGDDDYNFARMYYNSIYRDNPITNVPTPVLNRGDVVYKDDGVVNHIVNQDDGVTTSKMICFRIYFWFEGWDADCFDVIDQKTVTLNLQFSTKSPLED